MKSLSNSLFVKYESNKISNLAKIVGGQYQSTTWTSGSSGGFDLVDLATMINGPGPDEPMRGSNHPDVIFL